MRQATARPRFPRLPLLGAGALVAAALLAAGIGSLRGAAPDTDIAAQTATRDFRVADGAGGAVVVTDARDGRTIQTLTGENGFLRGALRALVRERRMDGIGAQQSFHLVAWADGRLTLEDPATGSKLELEAFGPDNAAVFARFLPAPAQGSHT